MPAPEFKVSEAAALLGVSDDTIRRWGESGRLTLHRRGPAPAVIDGAELASLARDIAEDGGASAVFPAGRASARNRLTGIVTRVVRDTVMAQVEIQAGPFRVVSLMSREAADELELQPGCVALASVKATDVVVELPGPAR